VVVGLWEAPRQADDYTQTQDDVLPASVVGRGSCREAAASGCPLGPRTTRGKQDGVRVLVDSASFSPS
jgi:hypothetical protein